MRKRREKPTPTTPHDEALKKLLQTFFAEFMALFFPEVDKLLDYSQTRLLMQELLVDVVGGSKRTLDLLLETRYKGVDAYVLIHLEPQSYKETGFNERMFIYFSRLFELYRKTHHLIIPIAIFTADDVKNEQNTLSMRTMEHDILYFQFLKVELRNNHWRQFIDSDNPVAAALLVKMGYTEGEEREMRIAYLRMILRLRKKLDDAHLELIMSVANLYFKPDAQEDIAIMKQLNEQNPREAEEVAELMSTWRREGYDKGVQEGIEKGIEKGVKETREATALSMLRDGEDASKIIKFTGLTEENIRTLRRKL